MANEQDRYPLGCIPNPPDARDHLFGATYRSALMPTQVNLIQHCPPPKQQAGQSCVGFSLQTLWEITDNIKTIADREERSGMYIYTRARMRDGSFPADGGSNIRSGCNTLLNYGVCSAELFPQNVGAATPVGPPQDVGAAPYRVLEYQFLPRSTASDYVNQIRLALSQSLPVVIALAIYSQFGNVGRDGIIEIPTPTSPRWGYHAVTLYGYDDATQYFYLQNQWGVGWANSGRALLPYGYMDYGFDAVVLVRVDNPDALPTPPEPPPVATTYQMTDEQFAQWQAEIAKQRTIHQGAK
jgi:hypothetical protein